jgi:SAM-dependent methyltransferase
VKTLKDIAWLRKTASFFPSRITLTADNYRVFDMLEGRGRTAGAVARAASTNKRGMELLLNSLVAIGLLEKKEGRYRNATVASRYLVKGRPDYQGDILAHYDDLWDSWSGLDLAVKTGRPQRKSGDHGSFILGMHNLALQRVKKIIGSLDLKGVKSVLDLGGGPGTYSMGFARRRVAATLFDLPETLKISKGLIEDAGLGDRVRLLAGDFTKDDLGGPYDMIFISQILHSFGAEQSVSLLRKCRASLSKGGRVIIQEFYLDETKSGPVQGALFAVNMLVNTTEGRTYTPAEMTSWLKKAGFEGREAKIIDETVLITGLKE